MESAHVLDSQFRLLREEMVRPLRKLLAQDLSGCGSRIFQLRNVRAIGVVCGGRHARPDCAYLQLAFDPEPRYIEAFKKDLGERLLPVGSMVCLFTPDGSAGGEKRLAFGSIVAADTQVREEVVFVELWCCINT